jgi:hypothetical protein
MSIINTSYGVWFNREDIERIEPVVYNEQRQMWEFTVKLNGKESHTNCSESEQKAYANRDELIRLIGEHDGTKEAIKVTVFVVVAFAVFYCIGYFTPMILKHL